MTLVRALSKFNIILSRHQKIRAFELMILMVFGGLIELCSVSLILPFTNAIMNQEEIMNKWYVIIVCDFLGIKSAVDFLIVISITLAILFIVKNVYLLLEYNLQYRYTYNNMLQMQKRLLRSFLRKPYEYYLNINSGEVIRVINNDVADVFYMLLLSLEIFTEAIVAIMITVGLFIISPVITGIIMIVILIIVAIIFFIIKPILYKAGLDYQNASAGMNKWILQAIQGVKEIRISNKEGFFETNFEKHGSKYVESLKKNRILEITPKFLIEATSMSALFILVALLIYRGNDVKEILPVITAIAMAATRLLPSINRISQSMAGLSYREARLNRLFEYIINDSEDVYQENDEEISDSERGNIFATSIVFKDVIYRYPDSSKYVLNGANLVIRRGESIGFVGASGSGKTTCIDVMLGLLDPEDGAVLLDDKDIRLCRRLWTSNIGYIPQSIFMLDDSIRNNVAFGVSEEEIDDNRVWDSLREASLDGFVKGLPKQLDTQIGERGVRLSGGQRQRIGIARALYSNPSVLVFDEATSSLDNSTEADVMKSINSLMNNRTIIIIAHRLSTIANCDHVYRVDNGKVILER